MILADVCLRKVRKFMNQFFLTTFSFSYFEAIFRFALSLWFFLVVEDYLFLLIFKLILKKIFPKIANGFQFFTIFAKSSISDVRQTFAKVLAICLLNFINIFHHISSNTILCVTLCSTYLLNNKNYNTLMIQLSAPIK